MWETGRYAPPSAVPSPAGFAGVLSPYRERRGKGYEVPAYAGMTAKGRVGARLDSGLRRNDGNGRFLGYAGTGASTL